MGAKIELNNRPLSKVTKLFRPELANSCLGLRMQFKTFHIKDVQAADTSVCEDCIKTGDTWAALRMCLTCAQVGCCDSSKNKHATKHFQETGHPVMKSVTPGEEFMWCYVDKVYL